MQPKLNLAVLGALAVVINAIRPEWPANSVATLLRGPELARQPLAHVAAAAVAAAQTPSTMTPAGIAARLRDDWIGSSKPLEKPTPGPREYPRCGHCSRLVTEPWEDHGQHCGQPLDGIPDRARRALSAGLDRARHGRETTAETAAA